MPSSFMQPDTDFQRSWWRLTETGVQSREVSSTTGKKRDKWERPTAIDQVKSVAAPKESRVRGPAKVDSNSLAEGRNPHLRRGHIRQQAHGSQHSERKQIFINPMWVNYVPIDDETTPAPTVTVKAASPRQLVRR
jgi:hypothetical protein